MTDLGGPRPQDRGYYGAGWNQPAPAPAPAPGQGQSQGGGQPYAPPLPPRRPRAEADPRRAFAPGASRVNTTGALIAVVSVLVVEFVAGVVNLLGTSLIVNPFSSYGAGNQLFGGFVSAVFVGPLPFYVGAFLAFAFLVPIARRSPLPVVLLRAVLAGAAGTVALALVGIVTGSSAAVRGYGASRLVIDVVTSPLQNGLPLTVMLLGSATVAWLWLGRPRGGTRRPLGVEGTLRQPDAVPPATVQPPASGSPYGAQPPQADRWAPPRG